MGAAAELEEGLTAFWPCSASWLLLAPVSDELDELDDSLELSWVAGASGVDDDSTVDEEDEVLLVVEVDLSPPCCPPLKHEAESEAPMAMFWM